MHVLLVKPPRGMLVDHWDGNGLNNCRKNLRVCTKQQNNMNTKKRSNRSSKYKGVHFRAGRWLAQIQVAGKKKHLGTFEEEADAALAYNFAATELFGPFARLNTAQEEAP